MKLSEMWSRILGKLRRLDDAFIRVIAEWIIEHCWTCKMSEVNEAYEAGYNDGCMNPSVLSEQAATGIPFCVKCLGPIKRGQLYSVVTIKHHRCPTIQPEYDGDALEPLACLDSGAGEEA